MRKIRNYERNFGYLVQNLVKMNLLGDYAIYDFIGHISVFFYKNLVPDIEVFKTY